MAAKKDEDAKAKFLVICGSFDIILQAAFFKGKEKF